MDSAMIGKIEKVPPHLGELRHAEAIKEVTFSSGLDRFATVSIDGHVARNGFPDSGSGVGRSFNDGKLAAFPHQKDLSGGSGDDFEPGRSGRGEVRDDHRG